MSLIGAIDKTSFFLLHPYLLMTGIAFIILYSGSFVWTKRYMIHRKIRNMAIWHFPSCLCCGSVGTVGWCLWIHSQWDASVAIGSSEWGDITPSRVSGFSSSYIEFDDWDEWSGEAETDKVNINTLANVSPSHQNRKVLCLKWKCSFELNFQKVPRLLPAACCLVLVGQLGKLF